MRLARPGGLVSLISSQPEFDSQSRNQTSKTQNKKMKFILSETIKEKRLTLADVIVNQFFVNKEGSLCQKVSHSSFNQITNALGEPYSDFYDGEDSDQPIQRILPNVERIEY